MSKENINQESKKNQDNEKSIHFNTHKHIDYGGDDCEHSLTPSKSLSEAERIMRRLMYRGD